MPKKLTKTRNRRPVKRPVGLSFAVVAIIEKQQWGVVYHDTVLQHYATLEKLTIRGKPWTIGSKVDFREIAKANEKGQR
jgi:hypothetical protein